MKTYYKLLSRSAFSLFKRYPHRCIATIMLSALVALCEGLSMVLVITLVDKGALSKFPYLFDVFGRWMNNTAPAEKIRWIVILLIGVTLFKGVVLYLYNRVTTFMQIEAIKLFRLKCLNQLLSLSMKYLRDQKISDLFTIITNNTKWVGSIISIANSVIPKICSGLALLFILINLSWQLTLASFVLLALSSLALHYVSTESKLSGDQSNTELLKLSEILMSLIQGMKEIRLFNKEKQFYGDTEKLIQTQGEAGYRNAMANALVMPIFEVATIVCLGVILCFASVILPKDNLNFAPTLLSFMIILFKMVMPVASINQARIQIAGMFPPVTKLFDFLEWHDKDYIPNGRKILKCFNQSIRFENVSFKYYKDEVLRNICLTIPKGSKIGIVGPSGSGKSTLVELLLRFYDPQQGSIYVDGIDIKSLDIASWRSNIGVVSQDTFLFNKTIRENIAFSEPAADFEIIKKAAYTAHAEEFINNMADGYDTILGERGVKVSGGQRQRLAIARAVLKDPEILIFDEATSSLDSESEKIVQQALNEAGKDKTTIVIAHRLATIFDADEIIVLEHGRIVQKGSHQALMQQEGLYSKMVELQKIGTEL